MRYLQLGNRHVCLLYNPLANANACLAVCRQDGVLMQKPCSMWSGRTSMQSLEVCCQNSSMQSLAVCRQNSVRCKALQYVVKTKLDTEPCSMSSRRSSMQSLAVSRQNRVRCKALQYVARRTSMQGLAVYVVRTVFDAEPCSMLSKQSSIQSFAVCCKDRARRRALQYVSKTDLNAEPCSMFSRHSSIQSLAVCRQDGPRCRALQYQGPCTFWLIKIHGFPCLSIELFC